MIILDATTKSLRIYMGGAAATTNPTYVASWVDITTTAFTPGSADGALNGATPVTPVAAPSAGAFRQIKFLTVWNNDTITQTITIEMYVSTTQRTMFRGNIDPGGCLMFTDTYGFEIMNAYGVPAAGGNVVTASALMNMNYGVTANVTGTKTITSGSSFLCYMGTAPKASSSVSIRYNVTTGAATITWAEMGVFKGLPLLGSNPTLTRLGSADISGTITATGRKNTTVSLSTNISVGDEIWVGIGNQASTAAVLRAFSLAEDLQIGLNVSGAVRISTVASPTAWTIDTAVPAWFAAVLA
jgi:hypothetical protein